MLDRSRHKVKNFAIEMETTHSFLSTCDRTIYDAGRMPDDPTRLYSCIWRLKLPVEKGSDVDVNVSRSTASGTSRWQACVVYSSKCHVYEFADDPRVAVQKALTTMARRQRDESIAHTNTVRWIEQFFPSLAPAIEQMKRENTYPGDYC